MKLLNKVCYCMSLLSIAAGTTIGLLAVWVEDVWCSDFTPKGLATTAILFVASTLGAVVTSVGMKEA